MPPRQRQGRRPIAQVSPLVWLADIVTLLGIVTHPSLYERTLEPLYGTGPRQFLLKHVILATI
jgi:hypothetical protein